MRPELDVRLRHAGSQINSSAGAEWAEGGSGFVDCGDCYRYKAVIPHIKM